MSLTVTNDDELDDHRDQRGRSTRRTSIISSTDPDEDDRLGGKEDGSKASRLHQQKLQYDQRHVESTTTTNNNHPSFIADFPTSPSSTTLDSHISAGARIEHVRYGHGSEKGFSIEIEQEPLSPSDTNDTIDRYYQQRLYRGPLGRHQADLGDGNELNGPVTGTTASIDSPSTAQTDGYPLTPWSAKDHEDDHSIVSSDYYQASNRLTTLLYDLKMDDLDAGYHQQPQQYQQQPSHRQVQRGVADDRLRYSVTSSTGTDNSNPATTPTSASHELFHTAAIKMHTKDIEAMQKAAQSGLATNPVAPNGSALTSSLPGNSHQARGLSSSVSKENLRAPLSLSNSHSGGSRRGRDVSPPRKSPLHQVTGFEDAQREWQERSDNDRDPATGFPLPPSAAHPTSMYAQSHGQSLASYRSQGATHHRYEQGQDEETLGSPHGSSPASPFNPRPGFTSYSPGQSGRGFIGHGGRQPGQGSGGRVPIGAAAYDGVNNPGSSTHLQSPPDNSHLGGPHSYSQPEIHDMARAHGAEGQDSESGRHPRKPYGNEGPSQQGNRPTPNGMNKPVLQRAWSDGPEQVGNNRRVEDPRDRMQGSKEEDERYAAQNSDSRGRRVESDRGDVRGHANNQAESIERPFATAAELPPDYVIAVIGQSLVGKTTIIRKAFRSWGLVEPATREDADPRSKVQVYTANVETGQPPRMRVVQILEVDLRLVQSGSREARGVLKHEWPQGTPRVDGVMICYDAMKNSSVAGLAEAIRDLCPDLPAMVVACKSDPDEDLAVQPLEGNEIGAPFNIGLVELSIYMPQGKHKMRMSFGWLLKAISKERRVARPAQPHPEPANENRARSNSDLHANNTGSEQFHEWHHSAERKPLSDAPAESDLVIRRTQSQGAVRMMQNGSISSRLREQPSENTQGESLQGETLVDDLPHDTLQVPSSTAEETDQAATSGAPVIPARREKPPPITVVTNGRVDPQKPPHSPSNPSKYVTFDELAEQLLRAIMTGSDNAFVNAFFLTYRRFVEPPAVMDKIYRRWSGVAKAQGMTASSKQWSYSRLLLAVVEWVRVYPGDFAFVDAREQLITFYREALSHAYLGHLSADLADSIGRLEHIRDLDESWSLAARLAKKNLSAPGQASGNTPNSSASPYSGLDDTTLEALNAPKNADPIRGQPLARAQSTLSTSTKDSASAYAVISPSDASQMGRPSVSSPPISFGNAFGGSMGSQSMSRTETRAGRGSSEGSRSVSEVESEGSRPFLRSLTLLEGLSDLAVAVELSKEEWRLFSQIRPRDYLRQVMGGERHSAIGHSVAHFNDISAWVVTLVLGHSRPKSRAKVYERLCAICVHLRRLHNYSTLCAITAGLDNFAVRRLAATRQLVRPMYETDLRTFLELVNPQASYSAYRAALKQDGMMGNKAIPFLGVVTQDLTKVHAVNTVDKDEQDAIHWKKYEVIADALGPISLYQSRQNPFATLPGSSAARQMIIDCPRLDEDAMYERSKHLEPDANQYSGSLLSSNFGAHSQRGLGTGASWSTGAVPAMPSIAHVAQVPTTARTNTARAASRPMLQTGLFPI